MTYYHPSRAAALEAAVELEALGFLARASLEPYNGWVIVLTPLTKAVFDQPLGPLLDRAEVDLSSYALLARRPADYKRPPPAEAQAGRRPPPAPPSAPPRPPLPPAARAAPPKPPSAPSGAPRAPAALAERPSK